MKRTLVIMIFTALAVCGCNDAYKKKVVYTGINVFVSPNGDDSNSGTIDSPVATLTQARDILRKKDFLKNGATVWLGDGIYKLSENPLVLETQDSGTTYRSMNPKKTHLLGAKQISPKDFKTVTDPATLKRIDKDLRGKILCLDLAKAGIVNINQYPEKFDDNGGIIELYLDSKRMQISRFPANDNEYMTIKEVLVNGGGNPDKEWYKYYQGDPSKKALPVAPGVFRYRDDGRHDVWANAIALGRGVWLKGYWRVAWGNSAIQVANINTKEKTVTFSTHINGGIGSKYHRPKGSGKEAYWLLNLLEEVRTPGQWAIDFVDNMLYFYPPYDISKSFIVIADTKKPIISINNASDITIRQMIIESGLGNGIQVKDSSNTLVCGNDIRNMTKYAVIFDGGFNNTALSNDMYNLGSGGIWLGGGDETTTPMTKANHQVINNHIHHFGQIEKIYAPAVNSGYSSGASHYPAVGMRVANNLIHDTPHAGVLFSSWESLFEYNEVFRFCKVSNDMGAFYSYVDYPGSGNNTFRYNFMHSSPGGGDGIYFDNHHHNEKIYGNITYLATTAKVYGTAYLVKKTSLESGGKVFCYNNIAVGSNTGFTMFAAEGSKIEKNVAVNCRRLFVWSKMDKDGKYNRSSEKDLASGKNAGYKCDPGFMDMDKLDLRIKSDSQVFKDLPDFKPVDMDRIGLYVDEYRTSLPTPKELELDRVYKTGLHNEILDRPKD